ncbi:MAG: type II secretion system inner membrane protein GspF [Gammaproteobacteria bacterium]|nr:type II secretion system inner membrane protein GspF [Gammaproteobacteria bacterium]
MAAFEYLALDTGGRSQKGILTGDSPRHIRSQLRDQGLNPVDVRPVEESERKSSGFSLFKRKIPVANLALMTRQLATLVRSGMPLEESLRVLGEQVKLPRLKSVVAGLRSEIMEGTALSAALSQYQNIFPQYFCAMVEAGEASGQLDDILERLAEYTEQQNYLRQKIAVAMIYPVILTGVAITVVIALLTYVVPEVVRVFNQTGQDLPLLTQWLIISSDFVRQQGLVLFGLIVAAFILGSWLLRKENIRYRYEQIILSLPFIGDLTRTIISARLARILSILTESGVTLVDALGISMQIIKNLPVRESMSNAAESLREGGRLHTAMNKSGHFPPMLVHMISVGEESGELEKMLDKSANHHEHEMNTMITAATSLLEPVLIIVMGGIVLLIVLAILLPIFEMNQLVGL